MEEYEPSVDTGRPFARMTRWLKFLGTISCATAIVIEAAIIFTVARVAYGIWDDERPPISQGKLNRLTSAMDTDSVRRLLGNPSDTTTFTNERGETCTEWTYRGPAGWKEILVYFGPDGRFQRQYQD